MSQVSATRKGSWVTKDGHLQHQLPVLPFRLPIIVTLGLGETRALFTPHFSSLRGYFLHFVTIRYDRRG